MLVSAILQSLRASAGLSSPGREAEVLSGVWKITQRAMIKRRRSYGKIRARNISVWPHLKRRNFGAERNEGHDHGVKKPEVSAGLDTSQDLQTICKPVLLSSGIQETKNVLFGRPPRRWKDRIVKQYITVSPSISLTLRRFDPFPKTKKTYIFL